ncbi:MAG: cobalamin-binding protein [Gemmatimonadetes bacterium]|nr:cobalamin-binding protein [Gemmatimonadota bacterium]
MEERIVSLLASGTEIVAALELGDALVGISHECDHPAAVLDRPRVSRPRFDPEGLDSGAIDRAVRQAMAEHGSVYQVDAELLAELRPSLVLTQAVCEVCAVPTPGVRETVRRLGLDAEVLSLDAHSLADILATVRQVATAAGVAARGDAVAGALEDRLARVRSAVEGRPRPRVLGIEWLDPPFTPGHWVPEMIVTAGGECVEGDAGARSDETTWEALEGLDPDVLLLMPCGYGLEASIEDANRQAERLATVAPRAIAEGRAFVVDGSSFFNRSGPRAVVGVEMLAGLLHPDVWAAPDATAAAVWRPDRRTARP